MKRKNTGFTLVELITVIVLLGIIGSATFAFLGFGGNVFRDSVERSALASEGRFVIMRLSRDVKNAVPYSVRVNQDCVELAPIDASSLYLDLPITGLIPDMLVADSGILATAAYEGARVFVYANTTEHVYGSLVGDERWFEIQNASSSGNELTFDLIGGEFSRESPARRYYVSKSPVSWCQSGRELYRFSGYDWSETQLTFSQLAFQCGAGACEQALMAQQLVVSPANPLFRYEEPTLLRSALVQVELTFQRNNTAETISLLHEIHLPNVP